MPCGMKRKGNAIPGLAEENAGGKTPGWEERPLFIHRGERKEQGLHSSDPSYQLPSDNENINKTTS